MQCDCPHVSHCHAPGLQGGSCCLQVWEGLQSKDVSLDGWARVHPAKIDAVQKMQSVALHTRSLIEYAVDVVPWFASRPWCVWCVCVCVCLTERVWDYLPILLWGVDEPPPHPQRKGEQKRSWPDMVSNVDCPKSPVYTSRFERVCVAL